MSKSGQRSSSNELGIKVTPINGHLGCSKYYNPNWTTEAFVIPRYQDIKKIPLKELRYYGIYFFINFITPSYTEPIIYVGQAMTRNNGESISYRTNEHRKNIKEAYYDDWTHVIFITFNNNSWGHDTIDALEHIFYKMTESDNLNRKEPARHAYEHSEGWAEQVRHINAYLAVIGVPGFCDALEDENSSIEVQAVIEDTGTVEDLHSGLERIPEIVTPSKIVKAMVNMMPQELFNPDTTFIDPACKGGEYLRELYDRLMASDGLIAAYPNREARSIHILSKQLYGIALSQVSLDRTALKLNGFKYNIKIIPDYTSILKAKVRDGSQEDKQKYIREKILKEFGRQVNFDVVIGNPPYQDSNGSGNGGGGTALYDKFVLGALGISNRYIAFITPARWYTDEKRVLALKETLLSSNSMIELHDFPNADEIFNGVYIMGGVCYYLIDKQYKGKCRVIEHRDGKFFESVRPLKEDFSDIFIRNSDAVSILKKVVNHSNEFKSFFGLINDYNIFKLRSYERGSYICTNEYDIKLYYTGNDSKGGGIGYLSLNDITSGLNLINAHKVYINSVSDNMLQFPYKTLYKGFYGEPGSVCTESYLVIGPLTCKEEADRIIKYLQTRFVRILVQQRKVSQLAYKKVYRFVPLQDFTSTSDIDWTQPLPDIDQQLYKKYNLTPSEIEYIESTIKPYE